MRELFSRGETEAVCSHRLQLQRDEKLVQSVLTKSIVNSPSPVDPSECLFHHWLTGKIFFRGAEVTVARMNLSPLAPHPSPPIPTPHPLPFTPK